MGANGARREKQLLAIIFCQSSSEHGAVLLLLKPSSDDTQQHLRAPPSGHHRRGYPLVCGPLVFSAGLPDLPSRSGGAQLRSRPQIGHVRVRPPLSDPHPRRPTEALLVSCINGEVEGKRAKLFLTLKVSMFFIF